MDEFADLLNNLHMSGLPLLEVFGKRMDRFHQAAAQGDLATIKHFVDAFEGEKRCAEILLNTRNKDGLSIFHVAATGGSTNVIKYLLEEGNVDIDVKDWEAGHTALHIAIMSGYNDTASFLLKKGASPNAETQRKRTPLHYAVEYGTKKVIQLLISKGSDINAVADCGTPLQLAAAKHKKDAVEVLLEKHANPNRMSHDLITPLISSVVARSDECMKMLLEAGADPNIHGSQGMTSLGWAATLENTADIIKCLLKYGADPNVTDNLGVTPLEAAALSNCQQNIMILLPVTSPIPKTPEWSFKGLITYVYSNEVILERNRKMKEQIMLPIAAGADSLKRKNYFDATQHYSEAIRYDPTNTYLMSKRSLCWARMNEGEFAMISAQRCLALKPQWPKAHLRVGEAYMVLKEFDKAARAFQDGLKLDRNNEELKSAFREALESKKSQPVWVSSLESFDAAIYA